LGQPFGVIGILIPGQTAVHGLTEQGHQLVLHVATGATLLQVVSRHLCESQGFVQLASCQKPSVRGDGGTVEFQVYPAVELEFDRGADVFTHWVPPWSLRYQET
jgi:hypothetical protein